MKLQDQVRKTIREYDMIAPGDHVILGLSGGADSLCLLLCLHRLQKQLDFGLSAVHVNHGIRGTEADRDASFAENLCRELEVPISVFCVDVPAYVKEQGCSSEEAGRILRYRCLEEEAQRWQSMEEHRVRIALAHHQDDQAETVLLNLCRGTGVRGMGGIPPVHGNRIRPLIEVRRRDILAWLQEQGREWCEDATNQEDDYTRNRIRHGILPRMEEEINDRSVEHICAAAAQARELDEWLEAEAQQWIREHVTGEDSGAYASGDKEGLHVPRKPLEVLPGVLRKRILQRCLERAARASKDITSRHIEALNDLVNSSSGKQLDLPYGVMARCRRDEIFLASPIRCQAPECKSPVTSPTRCPPTRSLAPECKSVPEYKSPARSLAPECKNYAELRVGDIMDDVIRLDDALWQIKTEMRTWSGEKIPENRYTKWFDYDKINGTLQLRNRRSGDTIALSGVGRKKVNRYMIDAGIPAELREHIPLLVEGEHRVLWVVGHRMSADYQVSESTQRILAVTIQPAGEV